MWVGQFNTYIAYQYDDNVNSVKESHDANLINKIIKKQMSASFFQRSW